MCGFLFKILLLQQKGKGSSYVLIYLGLFYANFHSFINLKCYV